MEKNALTEEMIDQIFETAKSATKANLEGREGIMPLAIASVWYEDDTKSVGTSLLIDRRAMKSQEAIDRVGERIGKEIQNALNLDGETSEESYS